MEADINSSNKIPEEKDFKQSVQHNNDVSLTMMCVQ